MSNVKKIRKFILFVYDLGEIRLPDNFDTISDTKMKEIYRMTISHTLTKAIAQGRNPQTFCLFTMLSELPYLTRETQDFVRCALKAW